MSNLTKDYLKRMYVDEKKSLHEIAADLSTYPNKIRRALIKFNIPIRDQSEAQSIALKTGRRQHPTKGKNRTKEEKTKISHKLKEAWNNKTSSQLLEHKKKVQDYWKTVSDSEKNEHLQKMVAGNLKSAKEGSAIERFIIDKLSENGYSVEFHKKDIVPNAKMSIDVYIPKLRTCIEIDGPSHYLNIWGAEHLKKVKKKDKTKNALIVDNGMNIIRLKVKEGYISDFDKLELWKNLEKTLKKIQESSIIKTVLEVE